MCLRIRFWNLYSDVHWQNCFTEIVNSNVILCAIQFIGKSMFVSVIKVDIKTELNWEKLQLGQW